jgi:hypothetical protein
MGETLNTSWKYKTISKRIRITIWYRHSHSTEISAGADHCSQGSLPCYCVNLQRQSQPAVAALPSPTIQLAKAHVSQRLAFINDRSKRILSPQRLLVSCSSDLAVALDEARTGLVRHTGLVRRSSLPSCCEARDLALGT